MDLVQAKQHRQKSSVKSNSMTGSNTTRNGTTKSWQHRKRLQTGPTKVWPTGINLSERSIQSFNINASEVRYDILHSIVSAILIHLA